MSFASDVNEPGARREDRRSTRPRPTSRNANYEMGRLLTEEARRQELIDLWTECTLEVSKEVEDKFDLTSNLAIAACTRQHDADQPDCCMDMRPCG